MGFEQYKTGVTAFDLYYDKFLHNNFRGARYRITLQGGESKIGVPTAGSIVNVQKPEFSFKADDGILYRIPFRDVASVKELTA